MTVSPDQTASLKSVLAAAEGDVEELERLIEEGEKAGNPDSHLPGPAQGTGLGKRRTSLLLASLVLHSTL